MKTAPLILAAFAFVVALSAFGAVATYPATAQTTSDFKPIRTHAELNAYLKFTSADQSPLSLLPAGARKRFLGTFAWGENGLGGFSTADLQQYLTNAQINLVLALFDAQSYAASIHGRVTPLTAAERDAPETALERKFDKLYFANAEATHGDRQPSSVPMLYDRLLASYQKPSTLAKLNASDLGLLFRGATKASSVSHDSRYLDDLRLDLAALHRRKLATTAQISEVHDQLIAARRFRDANALSHEYPTAGLAPLPPLRQAPNVHEGNPTALVMEPDGKSMLRKPIDMSAPLRIVVIAGCHFSVDAARAIRADPQLDKLFHEHAVWLASENESLPDVLQWNREFPDQIMRVAWRNAEWRELDSWAIPTFYVFRNGTLIDQWSGWPADTGMRTLRAHLEKFGLLH